MTIESIQAIDVHAHYGRYHQDEISPLTNDFMSAEASLVVERARRANTRSTASS